MKVISRAALAALVPLAFAGGIGLCTSAYADPNDDPVLCPNHRCTRGPEGGQGEASQRARAGDEHKYLVDVRRALGNDPDAAKSDAQLLADGRRTCDYRRADHESINLPSVSAAAAAWALTDLCPEIGDY